MPFSFHVEGRTCLKTFWGRVTAAEIRECERRARPLDFDAILSDFSRVTRLEFGTRDLNGLAHMYGLRRPRAIVATRPQVFSCARMFEWLMKRSMRRVEVEVFQDYETARAWLKAGHPPRAEGFMMLPADEVMRTAGA